MGQPLVDFPIIPEVNDEIIGDWTMDELEEEWITKEWAIKREHISQIKGVKFKYVRGKGICKIRNAELVADGKVIASDMHIDSVGRHASPQYTLKVPEGAKANNGLVLRVSLSADKEKGNSGQVVLILEDDE